MIRVASPEIGDQELRAVEEVLRSGQLVQATRVRAFEAAVEAHLGVRHAVAVSSGTAALHLALLALGIGPGDEVLVPDFTFPASANVVELTGATPVLVDIDLATYNVDVERLRAAVTARSRAVMPVHLFGLPAAMDPILEIAREKRLLVVEDAACALGAEYRGRPCGTLSEAGCFSFHPRKVITTGEGGMVVTSDGALAERIISLRSHGQVQAGGRTRFEQAGFNYRMTEMQGALGVAQMGRLPSIVERRTALAARYGVALRGLDRVTLPVVPEGLRPVWQAYVVLLAEGIDRTAVQARLREQGIETTLGTYAVSAQPHYAGPGRPLPKSLRAQEQALALPLHPGLSEADVDTVARALGAALGA
ncbi:MAG TPA: DegT/DnrJ/EryC1/StrS family aminotransferase [Vicinamibacteria bacterium]|nr:DegT/DnrJ/EryC1/StrS family aminotransferase [Vicinamibacteria bacterium]